MLEITHKSGRQFELLEIAGRLETSNAEKLESKIADIINNTKSLDIIFNLSKLEYCSSYGLRIFIKLKKDLAPYDGRIFFLDSTNFFLELLDMTGLEKQFIFARNISEIWNKLLT
ncbi:MAG: STAS domain-containing protein [Bacteroidales bacterium]|nr:STAS domain-containing protein [Bacteroidales bacterium]